MEPEESESVCLGSFGIDRVCFSTPPPTKAVVQLSDLTINTGSSELCNAIANDRSADYCVLVAEGFTLANGATIRAYGPKPLVIVSRRTR